MASTPIVLLAALGATLYLSLLGLALARWLRPGWAPVSSVAPALGWGVWSAVSFPLQDAFGFTRLSTALVALAALAIALIALFRLRREAGGGGRLPIWAFVLAAAIALSPLFSLLPKPIADGVLLGPTAFDHSKIAMIDEMTRQGLPAGNPFFGALGSRSALTYYYLWHFGAAQLSILSGASGWEADAAMTGFTAYASMLLMMGLASRLCLWDGPGQGGGMAARGRGREAAPRGRVRPAIAVFWVALLGLTGSLRPLLSRLLGPEGTSRLLSPYPGLAGWMVQASWTPQHMASACCVVLAVLLLADLAGTRRPGAGLVIGALAAAGFGSSAWVGGVSFAACATGVGALGLVRLRGAARTRFVVGAAASAVVAVGLAIPFALIELGTLKDRGGGAPIAYHPYEVVGTFAPHGLNRMLDYPAYWLLLLPIELTAIYPTGMAAMAVRARRALRDPDPDPGRDLHVLALTVMTLVSLGVAWLLASRIGNNDLGWRAILPAVLALNVFAAAGLARWIAFRAFAPIAAAVALIAVCLPDAQGLANIGGNPSDDAAAFADEPALWSAVRRYAKPTDRVANDPLDMDELTKWPVNAGWALLSNRASCYSGLQTAYVFVNGPRARIAGLDDQFTRVFDGRPDPGDLRQMAQAYGCRVVALTPDDGAWDKDPFARSPDYRLAEARPDRWRIYVSTTPQR